MSAMTRSPLLVAAAAAALALGACGGSGGGSGSANSQEDKAFEGALKFAKCMREHGIDMPDPKKDANGGIKQTVNGRPGSRAAMQAAQKACQKYMKAGGGRAPSAAEQAKIKTAMLAYAKCMRDHGIDVPDPKFSGGGIQFELGSRNGDSGGPNPNSPAFKAADKLCHSTLSGLPQKFKSGPVGGGGPDTSSGAEEGKG
jgi:hypothetical protein